ncbi:uncharacterized protein LOC143032207 [Oratosquilla oratoria]|uniref:uncharacterized protein LOC143032207 n=1 Tax=Oratosquilla oratoria TaxID=337810 RepID=UPI003F75DF41
MGALSSTKGITGRVFLREGYSLQPSLAPFRLSAEVKAALASPAGGDKLSYSPTCRDERLETITVRRKGFETIISIIQTYAPQQGRSLREKEQFYETLEAMTEEIRYQEIIVMGDMNGHVGKNRDGVEHVIGEFSIGEKNQEGESNRLLCDE